MFLNFIKVPDLKLVIGLIVFSVTSEMIFMYFFPWAFGISPIENLLQSGSLPVTYLAPNFRDLPIPCTCLQLRIIEVIIPGVLSSMLSRFDEVNGSRYLPLTILGYLLGLTLCFFTTVMTKTI